MDFLDELVDPSTDLTERTGRLLCTLFGNALLYSEEKFWYEMNWFKFTEKEAWDHINKLQNEFMPIMGLHSWPHGQGEDLKKAIQYQADKDDFYEQRFKR